MPKAGAVHREQHVVADDRAGPRGRARDNAISTYKHEPRRVREAEEFRYRMLRAAFGLR